MAEPVYKDSVPIPDKINTEKDVPPNMPGSGIKVEKEPKPVTPKVVKKAGGGSASSRADGCAQRGKTKGTIVMCGGGMYK